MFEMKAVRIAVNGFISSMWFIPGAVSKWSGLDAERSTVVLGKDSGDVVDYYGKNIWSLLSLIKTSLVTMLKNNYSLSPWVRHVT